MLRTMRAKIGAAALLLAATGAAAAWAAGEAVHVDRQKWSFGGILGHFDDSQLQRGFMV
jgi:ubiquinol-cytochrome c reductase cytochrome c1 subunit